MTNKEKALLILEALDEVININWNMQSRMVAKIVKTLEQIDQDEQSGNP